jgi:hypothetical protein
MNQSPQLCAWRSGVRDAAAAGYAFSHQERCNCLCDAAVQHKKFEPRRVVLGDMASVRQYAVSFHLAQQLVQAVVRGDARDLGGLLLMLHHATDRHLACKHNFGLSDTFAGRLGPSSRVLGCRTSASSWDTGSWDTGSWDTGSTGRSRGRRGGSLRRSESEGCRLATGERIAQT